MKAYFIDRRGCTKCLQTLSNRLRKLLPQFIHPPQYGFIASINIFLNDIEVLLVNMKEQTWGVVF